MPNLRHLTCRVSHTKRSCAWVHLDHRCTTAITEEFCCVRLYSLTVHALLMSLMCFQLDELAVQTHNAVTMCRWEVAPALSMAARECSLRILVKQHNLEKQSEIGLKCGSRWCTKPSRQRVALYSVGQFCFPYMFPFLLCTDSSRYVCQIHIMLVHRGLFCLCIHNVYSFSYFFFLFTCIFVYFLYVVVTLPSSVLM